MIRLILSLNINGYTKCLIQIRKVIELIGYMEVRQDDLTIFVPKSQPAIEVSEMLPPDLLYKFKELKKKSNHAKNEM